MSWSLFLSMGTQVGFQVCTLQEAPPTDAASVRSLSGVASNVLLQMPAVGETLTAQRAAEGFLARVDPQVDPQIPLASALFAADVAAVQLQSRVGLHVLPQGGCAFEKLSTYGAAL